MKMNGFFIHLKHSAKGKPSAYLKKYTIHVVWPNNKQKLPNNKQKLYI